MRKNIICSLLVVLVINFLTGCSIATDNQSNGLKELSYEDIEDKLIRFHVLANSDSDEDQELKLKVRDKIIEEMTLKLKDSKTLDEAREILISNIDEVNNIATRVIEAEGYNYTVKTMLSNENFPDKIYGDYIFPQGNYEAYRVIIGEGKGQNWWCVMFPPLCFVDESKNVVDSQELDKEIENLEITSKTEKKEDSKIKIKFKFAEILNKIFN